ncbi:protoporphyrinogen oxidase [Alteribacter keqinensis]|uniref:Coproporphyrinogen III oxidase n=1 Tax=Alteribacter keqinensis TaxID=2483800 RepID=A0A3M7TPM7_9BACI|nr:protoporphyrinogen oxidase [Alteribacter keqinensis]RNA67106.1 protoporphyrinogen oxidase [Alteribacter keqinensis]
MKKIAIIGGGMTGLTAMYYLNRKMKERGTDTELVMIEANDHLGGKIHTVERDGFIMETGADSIVARHESVMPLIEDLGLKDDVVYNSSGVSFIYTDNTLFPIPVDTIFGIPTSVKSLYESTLVSEAGKKAALKDLETPNEGFTKESSVGDFLTFFLGGELVEKQIAPVLSGVFSGTLDKLTVGATLPFLIDYKEKYGSIIKGLEAHKEQFKAGSSRKFLSFKGGLSTIIDRMEEKLGDHTILKGVHVSKIYKENGMYRLELSNSNELTVDGVVLSTPHDVTQRLLGSPEVDVNFNELKNSSIKTVYLGYDIPADRLPADGTGFIVSGENDIHCDACTWTSKKWAHTSRNGKLLVRLFYKSTNLSYPELKKMDDETFAAFARKDIEKSLGIQEAPTTVEVTNWDNLMPNYHKKHTESVAALEAKMASLYPNVILAGCSYYGVGIGACIQNGKDTAETVAHLTRQMDRGEDDGQ